MSGSYTSSIILNLILYSHLKNPKLSSDVKPEISRISEEWAAGCQLPD